MFKHARRLVRLTVKMAIVAGAAFAAVFLWRHYVNGPWTRDGQVQADVIAIAPEVSGRVVKLSVADNQLVRKGDVLWHIHAGDQATVTLMGFDTPVLGHIESIARGINSPNYDPGTLGLATVNPVFTWVRLAQRIPVRIHIDKVPPSVLLAAGMTCTVTVGPQAAGGGSSLHGVLSRLVSD